MKYKVGNKVRVRKDLDESTYYGGYGVRSEMLDKVGCVVTIEKLLSNCYRIDECGYIWTDEMFEGLVEDELTAEEGIRILGEMCCKNNCITECPIRKEICNGMPCQELLREYPEKVVEILKQFKKDHEKKPIEIEIVYLIKVMKEEGDSTTCIYTYEVNEDKDDIDKKMDELVKQYYEENGGKIYAKCERICRVKS